MDLAADVVSLFPNGDREGRGMPLECRPTTYLIYLSAAGSLVTVAAAADGSAMLWEQLELFGTIDVEPHLRDGGRGP